MINNCISIWAPGKVQVNQILSNPIDGNTGSYHIFVITCKDY